MKNRIIAWITVAMVIVLAMAQVSCAAATSSEAYIPSDKSMTVEIKDFNLIKNLKKDITECEFRKTKAHELAEAARALGFADSSIIIQTAKTEWANAEKRRLGINKTLQAWEKKAEEYPYATYVWLYLKDLGYNDYVCAGILGNIMAEVGGGTLEIQYWLYGGKIHYGMCQWNKNYYPEVVGKDLPTQCSFLSGNIKTEFNTFGSKYQSGFNYDKFLSLKDYEQAALAFAKCYERCNSAYYKVRQKNAKIAYDYFVI